MCPACLASEAVFAAGTSTAGGAAALVLGAITSKLLRRPAQDPVRLPMTDNDPPEQGFHTKELGSSQETAVLEAGTCARA